MKQAPPAKSAPRVGVLLLNEQLRPIHYNTEAARILSYPEKDRSLSALEAIFPTSRLHQGRGEPAVPDVLTFTSGRRRYVCRAFQLDTDEGADQGTQPQVLLVLERENRTETDAARWSEQYQLSQRECETVELLLKGLTSKEIATAMRISPHTVKAFLKLAMAKVGASNRTELIARILQNASLVLLALLPFTLLS